MRPAFTYSRAGLACAIIGGYVVRDPDNDALKGRYVYGDSCTGRLSSLLLSPAAGSGNRAFGRVVSPTSFGENALGRVYVTSFTGGVYRLASS